MFDLNKLLNFLKGRRRIGCDLGSLSLKLVKLEQKNEAFGLIDKRRIMLPDNLNRNDLVTLIRNYMEEEDFSADGKTSVNIEDPTLFIRRMILPKMPERDMKTAIRWNFREFVDGSVDDYIVDYLPIEGFEESGKVSVSAFCVKRESIENTQSFIKDVGMHVVSVEPNATALLAAFDYNIGWSTGKYYAMIDVGESVANFVVLGNKCLLFSRPLSNLSGQKLVEMISKDILSDYSTAREITKNYLLQLGGENVSDDKLTPENASIIDKTISNFISQIVVEVQRSIDAFCLMYHRDRIDKIYLCGGGVYLPNIVERFSSGLGVEVELFNPFLKIENAEAASLGKDAPLYAVAVGLALPRE